MGRWVRRAQGTGGPWHDGDPDLEGKASIRRPASRAPRTYFWVRVKESWQATAKPPIRLRNSWKSSCPSRLVSNFFIMRSRTPGSFWFCRGDNNNNNDNTDSPPLYCPS